MGKRDGITGAQSSAYHQTKRDEHNRQSTTGVGTWVLAIGKNPRGYHESELCICVT